MGCCLDSRSETKVPQCSPSPTPDLTIHAGHFLQKLTEPISYRYRIVGKLGQGSFGEVSLGEHKQTHLQRAIKEIRKFPGHQSSQFIDEVAILSRTDHPHIMKVYEFYETQDRYYIVSELLTGGELFDYVVKSRHLSEALAARVMDQLLGAVGYLHQLGIVHRDLKPENLLLEVPPKDSLINIKLIDFGTSCLISSAEKLKQRLGTPFYMAPEVLKGNYTEKCDLWSCGVIAYLLLSGCLPFNSKSDAEVLEQVQSSTVEFPASRWKGVSEDAKDLTRALLVRDWGLRLTAAQALQHSWIQHYRVNPSLSTEVIQTSLAALGSFHAEQKLKQAIMAYIAAQYTSREQTKALTESFKGLDLNGDGRLSREELINGYRATMSGEEAAATLERVMKTVDCDGSGYVDYSEFILAAINEQTLLSKGNLETAFRSLDCDNSGKISLQEMRGMLSMGVDGNDSVWAKLVQDADMNGDGEIDLVEFTRLMLSQTLL